MKEPKLSQPKKLESLISAFGGLDRGARIAEGKLRDCENLTGDAYPLLQVRKPRGRWTQTGGEGANESGLFVFNEEIRAAATVDNGLSWVTDTTLYIAGKPVLGVLLDASARKSVVPVGRELFLAPDGLYVTRNGSRWSAAAAARTNTTLAGSTVTVTLADADGTALTPDATGDTPPESPANGCRWLDTSGMQPVLRVRNAATEQWVELTGVYAAVSCAGIGSGLRRDDTVTVTGLQDAALNGTVVLTAVSPDRLVFAGMCSAGVQTQTEAVTVHRRMPVLDFAVEHGNRIWGCRCGLNDEGEYVNEIYCSRLGDPLGWCSYRGLSTDSYCASLGVPGAFTGAAVCGDEVLFFKEYSITRVTGTEPADFRVTTMAAKGIREGCHRSAVCAGDRLFYCGVDGVYVYDGTLPYCISEALGTEGYTDAVGGVLGGKYFAAMTDRDARRSMYVYDTQRGLWHREDDSGKTRFLLPYGNALYSIGCPAVTTLFGTTVYWYQVLVSDAAAPDKLPCCMLGEELTPADYSYVACGRVEWFAETGELGLAEPDAKKLRQLQLRVRLGQDAVLRVAIAEEAEDAWREIAVVSGGHKGSFTVAVRTPRCDSFRLRLAGKGDCTVYSVRLVAERTNGGERV